MLRTFIPYLCLGLSLFLTLDQADAKSPRTVAVIVDPVRTIISSDTSPILGQVVALRNGPIATDVAGTVRHIAVRVGDTVKAGDILTELDTTSLQLKADVARAEENLRAAEVQQANASTRTERHKLQRLERLKSSAAFTKSRYEDQQDASLSARAAADAAAAHHAVAAANRKLAERDLERSILRAPFDAVVMQRHVNVGGYVTAGDEMVTLLDRSTIELEAQIPADDLTKSHVIGLTVNIHPTPGITQQATIRAVLPQENPRTRTRTARFTLLHHPKHAPLAVNRTVIIDFPRGHGQTYLTVAKDAVIQRSGKTVVMLATPEGAQVRPVTLGETLGNRFIVRSGLSEGDLTVVRGNERLREGSILSYTVATP